jgi:lipase chaperone LimK
VNLSRAAALAAASAALAGMALAAWLGSSPRGAVPVDAAALPVAAPASAPQASGPGAALAAPPGADAATLSAWRRERSSLRGTELDGSWGLDAQGRLQPTLALRRRFDHLLLLRDGEAGTATLARLVRQEVEAAAGAAAAQQVLDVWQRYVDLLDMRFATRVDLARPETWGPALAERQRARRDRLGLAWAQAFYADEEAELQALINTQGRSDRSPAAPAAAAPAASGVMVLGLQRGGLGPEQRAALSPEQRERLQAVEAEQAQWTGRLDEARREVDALRVAAHLSAPQRREAIEAWLAQHFDAQEQVRVRALLELPPAGAP